MKRRPNDPKRSRRATATTRLPNGIPTGPQACAIDERERYTHVLLDALPAGAAVLELGCGAGIPTTQRLAARFAVTGVDISARQIALARHNVPNATFMRADMTTLDFPTRLFRCGLRLLHDHAHPA